MANKFFITNLIDAYPDPALYTYIRRLEELLGSGMDQLRLESRNGRYPHGYPSVVTVIVGEHTEDLFVHEERGLTMRDFFESARHTKADPSNSSYVLSVNVCFFVLSHSL
jgi:hypothetical protein